MENNNKLINRLLSFYKLEEFQVAYYKAQLSSSEGEYYRRVFSRMVDIESSHAEFFARKLKEMGMEVPKVSGSLFTLAGNILGETVELTGALNTCKLGVTLEKRAMQDYRNFIMETSSYPEINNILWEFYIDEEFHTMWMEDYLKKFEVNP
jgi:bacterioferritin